MSRHDLLPDSGGALDPNAVNELFEKVVYGDGLPMIEDNRGARRRRVEAERRRLEMEQRVRDNAMRRVQTEQNRQFFDNLILSGPDRPALPPSSVTPSINCNQLSRSSRILIPFTALDRSRVPRKTRQQWLDKFCTTMESTFPGAMISNEPIDVLSLEQSVYQTAKTATSYIGAWMNRIHAMKSASSLIDFLSPNVKQAVVEPREQTEQQARRNEVSSSLLPVQSQASEDRLRHLTADSNLSTEISLQTDVTISSSLFGVAETVKPGKASLLGNKLPFSLFGSDDEEEEQKTPGYLSEVQQPPPNEVVQQDEHSLEGSTPTHCSEAVLICTERKSFENNPAVPALIILKPSPDSSRSQDVAEPSQDRKSEESFEACSDPAQSEVLQPDVLYSEATKTNDITPSQLSLKPSPRKRKTIASNVANSISGKKQKVFDPECKVFIHDVVAAHLQLRFGKDLPGKIIVSIQARVVEKILCNPKWTLQRLRKHKRDIDELAERYAEKYRSNHSKNSVQNPNAVPT